MAGNAMCRTDYFYRFNSWLSVSAQDTQGGGI